jgi:hypothetical protein
VPRCPPCNLRRCPGRDSLGPMMNVSTPRNYMSSAREIPEREASTDTWTGADVSLRSGHPASAGSGHSASNARRVSGWTVVDKRRPVRIIAVTVGLTAKTTTLRFSGSRETRSDQCATWQITVRPCSIKTQSTAARVWSVLPLYQRSAGHPHRSQLASYPATRSEHDRKERYSRTEQVSWRGCGVIPVCKPQSIIAVSSNSRIHHMNTTGADVCSGAIVGA